MNFCLYLTPSSIIAPLKGTNKDEILKELVVHLAKRQGIADSKKLFRAIQEREATSSTFLPMGIAIPHARVDMVDNIVVVMGVTPQSIPDVGGEGALSARVFILFFSPAHEKEFGRHLKLLGRISAIFNDTPIVEKISSLSSPEEIFGYLQRREREIGGD